MAKIHTSHGEIDTAHGLYVLLTPKDAIDILDNLKKSDAKEKYEVTVNIYDQIRHFTLADFCRRLDIKPLHDEETKNGLWPN